MSRKRKSGDGPKLEEYIGLYNRHKNKRDELEVRFGTKYYNPITKINFNNALKKMKSIGFIQMEAESYHLNIQNEYIDPNTGKNRLSNIRTTIKGLYNIQKYCKTNTFDSNNIPDYITFMQKFRKSIRSQENRLEWIDYHDYEFRVNYKEERILDKSNRLLSNILNSWIDSKKTFRLIKRVTLIHPESPYKFDFSIIKTSNNVRGKSWLKPTHTIQESNVFDNSEHFEIELELLNDKCYNLLEGEIIVKVKRGIQHMLSGLQNTNYPVSYTELNNVLKEYLQLTKTQEEFKLLEEDNGYNRKKRKNRWNFIGPSTISLEMNNIIPLSSEYISIENINHPYTVTEKADGERKLLFISSNKKIYLIDINLNFEFTGLICDNSDYINTIIDGEHVLYDKHGKYINYYLCFDIYWLNGEDYRIYAFSNIEGMKYDKKIDEPKFRFNELNRVIKYANINSISKNDVIMNIQMKSFYSNDENSIFEQCKKILDNEQMGGFVYETDGLIFTPINKSVGSTKLGILEKNKTWPLSFKWKPPKYNTIDFLISTKKNDSDMDIINNIYNDGKDMLKNEQIQYFKTLLLRVGFDENKHGFLNPCEDVMKNNIYLEKNDKNNYKPVPFYPTNPTPSYHIHISHILLKNKDGRQQMLTENGEEEITDNTIVEFRFDKNAKEHWQWIPIRVRYDKTSDYKKGNRNYGNAYHVAQSVWRSINLPITEEIITTGDGIVENNLDDDVYYNRKSKETHTKSLRDFHNRYVKSKLITSVANRGNTLMDMTVGKGGDIQKWLNAKLSFVFGIDNSKDNIENKMDGACARYIKAKRKRRNMFDALFIHGDSSENIKQTTAAKSDKGKMVINALSGIGSKDKKRLGEGVYKKWGIAKNGFNIISNQFSIHYFFKDNKTLNGFIRNCSEYCAVGGYMIGTCYNGKKIFDRLKDKAINENIFLLEDSKKIWSITKLYQKEEMPNTTDCLGYTIDVYQESINKSFKEYLVNFDYFRILMEHYGFVLLTSEEANEIGLPNSMGSFEDLFRIMNEEYESKRLQQKQIGEGLSMSQNEKEISFLNNYFVFKKIRNVNTKNVYNIEIAKTDMGELGELQKSRETIKKIMAERISKKVNKKFNKKIKLPNMGEESEE
jgi:hypothetical protein